MAFAGTLRQCVRSTARGLIERKAALVHAAKHVRFMLKILVPLAGIVVLAAIVVAALAWRFAASIDADVEAVAAVTPTEHAIVTEERLARMPSIVRRYLTWSGVVGRPIPASVRLTQTGRIRGNPGDGWMAFEALTAYGTLAGCGCRAPASPSGSSPMATSPTSSSP